VSWGHRPARARARSGSGCRLCRLPERILTELRALAPIEEAGVESPGSLNQTALAKMYAKEDHRTAADRRKERQLAREKRIHQRK
jgi:hypothetical protein